MSRPTVTHEYPSAVAAFRAIRDAENTGTLAAVHIGAHDWPSVEVYAGPFGASRSYQESDATRAEREKDERDHHNARLDTPLHIEDVGDHHALCVWTIEDGHGIVERVNVYRKSHGRDDGRVLASRSLVGVDRAFAVAVARELAAGLS